MDYVIWSFDHCAWWGADRSGYVDDVLDAGLYSAQEAGQIATASLMMEELAIPLQFALAHGAPKYDPYKGPVI